MTTENEKTKIYIEQVKQVYLQEPFGLIATIINGAILTIIQMRVIDHVISYTWFLTLLLITLVRYFLLLKYKKIQLTAENVHRWGKGFIIGITISGILWGSTAFVLFPIEQIGNQIFVAFVLGGMSAGAAAAFSALRGAFFAYSLPALIPITIRFFTISDEMHIGMGMMISLFIVLTAAIALRIHRTTENSLKLRFENLNLIQYLSLEKERTEKMNYQLQAEIKERQKAEESLREHKEQLEVIVAERTKQLREANTALKESEEKYRLLVTNATDAIIILQDNIIKFFNPMALHISGYNEKELAEKPFKEIIHFEDREMVYNRYLKRIRGETAPNLYSFRIINKQGKEIWVNVNAVLIKWEGRPATLNFIRNINEKKKLEEQLQFAQKMEAIGTLAGGIAHDFNNLLMGIMGNATLAMLDIGPDRPEYEKIKNIEEYAQNGAELTKQLLGFARGGKYEVKPLDLNEIIYKTANMFGRTRKEISIHTKLQQHIWTVEADRIQLEQVLLNLFINAWQAMPDGGDLFIETENVILNRSEVESYHLAPGKFVKISVSDTGVGMDKQTLDKIFEPFFTTRDKGQSTGLGLASVYGIITNHNGIINATSKLGQGTTFTIFIPASTKEILQEQKSKDKSFNGIATILLVDDESIVLEVGRKMLKRLGFDVVTANTGEEAIKLYSENSDNINLVILDIIMPGMDGEDTFKSLKQIDPNVKVLLSSGYSLKDQANELLNGGCKGFIQKPFGIKDLSQKLETILNQSN